jgi:hypothetical protein
MLRFQNEKETSGCIQLHFTSYFISGRLCSWPLAILSLRSALVLQWIWFQKRWQCLRCETVRSDRCSRRFRGSHSTCRWREYVPPKARWTSTGLAGAPSQKTVFFHYHITYIQNPQLVFLHLAHFNRALLNIIFIRSIILKWKKKLFILTEKRFPCAYKPWEPKGAWRH